MASDPVHSSSNCEKNTFGEDLEEGLKVRRGGLFAKMAATILPTLGNTLRGGAVLLSSGESSTLHPPNLSWPCDGLSAIECGGHTIM